MGFFFKHMNDHFSERPQIFQGQKEISQNFPTPTASSSERSVNVCPAGQQCVSCIVCSFHCSMRQKKACTIRNKKVGIKMPPFL